MNCSWPRSHEACVLSPISYIRCSLTTTTTTYTTTPAATTTTTPACAITTRATTTTHHLCCCYYHDDEYGYWEANCSWPRLYDQACVLSPIPLILCSDTYIYRSKTTVTRPPHLPLYVSTDDYYCHYFGATRSRIIITNVKMVGQPRVSVPLQSFTLENRTRH